MKRFVFYCRALAAALVATAALGVAASGAKAQDAASGAKVQDPATAAQPTAEKILDQQVEAMGGKAAMEKQKNRVIDGTLEFKEMAMKGKITILQAAPNKARTKVELEGLGTQEEGYDGKIAWENSMMSGARIKEGDELANAARDATFNAELHWRDLYKETKVVGSEMVDGIDCWKLTVVPKAGTEQTWFMGKENHLLLKQMIKMQSPMGEMDVATYFSDHKKVDDVLVAHKLRQVMMGGLQEFVVTFDSIKANVELPADAFDAPEAVKSLPPSAAGATDGSNG